MDEARAQMWKGNLNIPGGKKWLIMGRMRKTDINHLAAEMERVWGWTWVADTATPVRDKHRHPKDEWGWMVNVTSAEYPRDRELTTDQGTLCIYEVGSAAANEGVSRQEQLQAH